MKKLLLTGAILPVLILAGCSGEGWDTQPYNDTPYGDRTAGIGIEYVRAALMPERGPVIEATMEENEILIVHEEPVIVAPEEEPVADKGETFFNKMQRK